jgi:uncharacterized protein (TIGR03083 family)
VLDSGCSIGDPAGPLIRQRRRLAGILATLDAEQWAEPSRCELWSVRDVVAHLMGINQLWSMSIAGRAGRPTRPFDGFDPVTTPRLRLGDVRNWSASAVRAGFVETTESLADMVGDMDPDEWSLMGETPLGHVSLHLVAVHALWDSWIHERDVLLPLGVARRAGPADACRSFRWAIYCAEQYRDESFVRRKRATALLPAARGAAWTHSFVADGLSIRTPASRRPDWRAPLMSRMAPGASGGLDDERVPE